MRFPAKMLRYVGVRTMERENVNSSVILAVGYDDDRSVLEVKFRTGRVYHYREVPRTAFEELLVADSAGTFFNEVIRPNYESELVYDPHRPGT